MVKIGRFADQDPHQLLLMSHRVGRWDLLVVPPRTDRAAGAPRASTLLAAEASRRDTDPTPPDAGAETAWESDDGAPPAAPVTIPIGPIHSFDGR